MNMNPISMDMSGAQNSINYCTRYVIEAKIVFFYFFCRSALISRPGQNNMGGLGLTRTFDKLHRLDFA